MINANKNRMDDFSDIFKKFYPSVKDKFTKNDEMPFDEFIIKYSEDKGFLKDLDFIKSY